MSAADAADSASPITRRRGITPLVPLAGPLLIVAAVLVVLHGFWLQEQLTNQHLDHLAHWLPRWCFLGRSLAAGHLPAWNPHQFGGIPFASDPQSGWLYLPPMLLFSALSCSRALGWMIVLNPILAGLGASWFLRREGLERPAATVGGLVLALLMASSSIALALPFAGALAWTTVVLGGAAGYVRARTGTAVIGWLALMVVGLSQVAAAHLTHGLLVSVIALVAYLMAHLIPSVRSGQRGWVHATLLFLFPFALFPLLAGAILIPRVAFLVRTPIGLGYQTMAALSGDLAGTGGDPAFGGGFGPWWITSFARGPSGYAGALTLLVVPFALLTRRFRRVVVALASVGLVGWLLNQKWVIRSGIADVAARTSIGELWLHAPARFRYLVVVAVAGLAAVGMQSWIDRRRQPDRGRPLAIMAGSVFIAGIAPIFFGARASLYVYLAVGLLVAAPLLLLFGSTRRWPVLLLPILLAVELVFTGLWQQRGPPVDADTQLRFARVNRKGLGLSFASYRHPYVDGREYMSPGAIGRILMAERDGYGRYLSFHPDVAPLERGFLLRQARPFWPAYENGRSVLFGIDEVQGYSPVQLDRYWRLVRRVNDAEIRYNAATFQTIDPQVLSLLGVRWLIVPEGFVVREVAGAKPVASEGGWRLLEVPDAPGRASVVFGVTAARPSASLDRVLSPDFDSRREAVVETVQGGEDGPLATQQPAPDASGSARYSELSPEHTRIDVDANRDGVVVVRNVWDRNWRATIDGEPVPVVQVDYLLQGIRIPAGRHVVELRYADKGLRWGLTVSAVSWATLGLAAAGVAARRRRSARSSPDRSSRDDATHRREPAGTPP